MTISLKPLDAADREAFTARTRALIDQFDAYRPALLVARAEAAVASLKGRSMSHQAVDDITELAVEWVRLNPVLVESDLPDVGR